MPFAHNTESMLPSCNEFVCVLCALDGKWNFVKKYIVKKWPVLLAAYSKDPSSNPEANVKKKW